MKPAARIQTAIDILNILKEKDLPMDLLIGDFMRSRRYIGSKDRAAVVERVYSCVRAQARLGWWLARAGLEDTPRSRIIAHLALTESASEKRLSDLFDGSQYAPAPLSAHECHALKNFADQPLNHPDMPLGVKTETPPAYEERLRAVFGDDFEAEMRAMMGAAPLDMRVNLFAQTREYVQEALQKDGVETLPTPYSPWGLRAQSKAYLAKTKAFAKRWIEIQDEGSQLIVLATGAAPGMQVLDYCAGGGGKTLALASAMARKGRIVAMDIDERRLNKGRLRFKKSGLADIIEVRPLSEERHRKWLRRQKGTFDVVLCDVPCSGSGTWRRNPDMRWNNYGPPMEELLTLQAEILDKVAHTVKPGGRLVYATCSLLREENEDQIAAFLTRHPDFKYAALPESLSFASLDPLKPAMRLTPHRHGTDGFFAAILEKTA